MAMPFDFTVNFSNIIEVSIIVGGLFISAGSFKRVVIDLEKRMASVEERIGQLGAVLTKLAVQSERLGRVESDIRELRHGRGFIRSIAPREGTDGEYP